MLSRYSASVLAVAVASLLCTLFGHSGAQPEKPAKDEAIFRKGDRVVFMGDTFAEREGMFGYIETTIQTRLPELGLTFRNLAYSADTPAVLLADMAKGDTDNNRGSNRALNFGVMTKHLTDVKADVIILCFGMTDSFRGPGAVDAFAKELQELITKYGAMKFNGQSAPRFVLIGPIAHEKLGGHFPDPTEHNKSLTVYNEAMRKVAQANKAPFVNLLAGTADLMSENTGDRLTFNGIHLTEYGYWATAHVLADQLFPRQRQPVRAKAGGQTKVDLLAQVRLIDWTPYYFPLAPIGSKIHSSLARKSLVVEIEGLPPGDYHLHLDGCGAGSASHEQWARGRTLPHTVWNQDADSLRHTIVFRNEQFFYRWRAVNGEYVYGRRAKPFGVVNFPQEMEEFDRLCNRYDMQIMEANKVPRIKSFKIDTEVSTLGLARTTVKPLAPPIEKVYSQKQGIIGGKEFDTAKDPQEAIKHFKLQEGYEINLFASEKDFPLHDPLAINFDSKGRCWVTTMPSYPHNIPGVPPNDKIIVLEDTDGDGKADKHIVFADGLYLPTGFEFGSGGVYLAAQPNILFLKDTNGDGKADVRETILHGFGTGDSHHAIHTFLWGPDGGMYFHEGIFHRTNTETPFGPLRQHDAGIYRFQPRNFKLETFVSYNFANPWGHVYDRWGQNFIADASGGANYFGLPLTGRTEFPDQHRGMKVFTSVVRPTCGCEIISSRHFPPEAQGNFLVNNNIGFQGIKQHKVLEEGSGFTSKELEPLLFSTDRNFRPVGITFGPDGALYIVDWFNPLIGHMQFSLRDPNRDHYHGRIWRITAKNRPLVKPAKIDGEPIANLLDLLKEYEDRTRYRARSELRERKSADVAAALPKWIASLKEDDPRYEHDLLEALWVYQTINVVEPQLLQRLLHAKDYHARAAATRALRHWRDRIGDGLELLQGQVNDVHPRVRLEAVVALSYLPSARAAEVALECLKHPMDYYLEYGLKETMTTLEPQWKPVVAAGKAFALDNVAGANYVLGNVSTTELVKTARSAPVFLALLTRDGVLPQYRQEALEGLAKLNKSNYLTELLAAIDRLDRNMSGHGGHVLHDLAQLLLARKQTELVEIKPRLEKLAVGGRMPHTRQVAYVALASAEGSLDRLWKQAAESNDALRDLVEAVPILPDLKLRASVYAQVKALLDPKTPRELRLAALNTISSIPGHDAEVFTLLSTAIRDNQERDGAVRSLRRIPRAKWPQDQVKPLAEFIVGFVKKVPPKQRTEPEILDVLQLGNDLALVLPPADAKTIRAELSELGVQVVLVRTVPHKMVYDRSKIYVEAGKPAVIVLENSDIMPHNLLIVAPGSMAEIGLAAEKMANDPDAFAKGFIPPSKKVLHATKMLQPREVQRLQFVAPDKPGDYPYVCTFPGHWRLMNGTLHVVPKLADIPPSELNPPTIDIAETRAFVRNWTVDELTPHLINAERERNFERGKELFKAASCLQCHKMQKEGGFIGPDLSEIPKKLIDRKLTRIGLVREIIEPSHQIEAKYKPYTFVTSKGEVVSGIIVAQDARTIQVANNPLEKPRVLKLDDIDEKTESKVSLMPTGLLVTLDQEEILDLLGYVITGGDPNHQAFVRRKKD